MKTSVQGYRLVKHASSGVTYYYTGFSHSETTAAGENFHVATTGLLPGDAHVFSDLSLANAASDRFNHHGIGGALWEVEAV